MHTGDKVVDITVPAHTRVVESSYLNLGHYQQQGRSLQVNNVSLVRDGKPWMPVMAEFHYSRYPQVEWEAELRKMRAGGVDIVASYIIWSHHEAQQGHYQWQGSADLRRFVALVQECGMLCYLRPGPWVHAEVRYGGFPDWLQLGCEGLRSNHPQYLTEVERWFNAIGQQLQGLMWEHGGPVVGVQLENEYGSTGPGCGAEHIAELKRLAVQAGMRVPLYTVTGWPTLDIPAQEVIPVSGAYADGFWGASQYQQDPSGVFVFNTMRSIGEMGNIEGTPASGQIDKQRYPFFLAEAGGGMHVSYHRRPVVTTEDVAATALVQVGSGANLYGYYMYHGGSNPPGTRLQETQDTGYPNDVPVVGYDFRAPLGQYGLARPSYGRLRTVHSFMAAFGEELAGMDAAIPNGYVPDASNLRDVRVAVRGAGRSGFVFINNHVRQYPMPHFADVHLRLQGDGWSQVFPGVHIANGVSCIWPFGLALGAARVAYATVQPLTRWSTEQGQVLVLFAVPGVAPEWVLDAAHVARVQSAGAKVERLPDQWRVTPLPDAYPVVVQVHTDDGQCHRVVVLSAKQADQAQRMEIAGAQRLVMSECMLYQQGDALVFQVPDDGVAQAHVYPSQGLGEGHGDEWALVCPALTEPVNAAAQGDVQCVLLHDQQIPPPVRMGPHVAWRQCSVPLAPSDAAYEQASQWEIIMPTAGPGDAQRVILALDYVGDAARLYANGQLVDDHYWDGETWRIGIDRFALDGRWPCLVLKVLAVNPALPIYLEDKARAQLRAHPHGADVLSVQMQCWREERVVFSEGGSL
ncbi:beta-galactosidase [Curvibacter sp. CHRR-16]|uniref:beta-galactosidase n=1 Tax=Curvibacter sp. CHRR-16 TaxID=2835872 RepID=UPI001BD9D570|nr:beta-galactosidase [Curvibacter sp. CHRR-16]MBT0570879.1 beta-galactosidase [Curvibacter sp. CHRR-16]